MRFEKKGNYYDGNGERGTGNGERGTGRGNGVTGKIQKPLSDKRMKNRLKFVKRPSRLPPPGRRKHNLCQLLPVDAAVGREHRSAEARDYGGDCRAARRFQLVNDIVRV